MKTILKVLFAIITSSSFVIATVHAQDESAYIYSPNKEFVLAWFDHDTGKPIGLIRSVILLQLPFGDKPFSLVTFPRHTQAYWSSNSKYCVIIDAPDNGNTNTWLFAAKDAGTQSDAIPIYPLKPLYENFRSRPSGSQLWRPAITKAVWKDDSTLEFDAHDNNGKFRITLNMNSLGNPIVSKTEQDAAVTLKPVTVDEWKAILSPIPEMLAGDAQGLSDALYKIGSPLTKIQKPATPESNRAGISGMLLLWYSRSIRTQFNSEADKDNWQMERNALTAMIRAGQKYHPELINDGWANLMKASEAKGFPRCDLPK